ncbi:hypothetical protein NW066_02350 [Mycoplasmopsis felis]|uniref:hypothetical protein n=1 Tax=Mycoplasmopsis felis TaxID=33923 RepID=UPI0021AF2A74|nr:hypothetical protein [Mycoplasmopsis felis]UWV85514.1 hypothetical protein NW066_02350 [Mycoplasmopsis felis]
MSYKRTISNKFNTSQPSFNISTAKINLIGLLVSSSEFTNNWLVLLLSSEPFIMIDVSLVNEFWIEFTNNSRELSFSLKYCNALVKTGISA